MNYQDQAFHQWKLLCQESVEDDAECRDGYDEKCSVPSLEHIFIVIKDHETLLEMSELLYEAGTDYDSPESWSQPRMSEKLSLSAILIPTSSLESSAVCRSVWGCFRNIPTR